MEHDDCPAPAAAASKPDPQAAAAVPRKPGYGLKLADGTLVGGGASAGELGPSASVRGARSGFVAAQIAKRPKAERTAAGLSEEAKRQRVEEMTRLADSNVQDRKRRVEAKIREDAREDAASGASMGRSKPTFLSDMRVKGLDGSIEERIRSKRHTQQRPDR